MKVNEDYSLAVNTEINAENIRRALKVLIDNGLDPDEAGVVLDAIGCTLIFIDTGYYSLFLIKMLPCNFCGVAIFFCRSW